MTLKFQMVVLIRFTVYFLLCSVDGGELFDKIVQVGKFTEFEAKVLFYQMLLAVEVSLSNLAVFHYC